MADAICKELAIRKDFLPKGSEVQTVYFGGGTPSLLRSDLLEKILATIQAHYPTSLEEVSLEANPDDLSPKNLDAWRSLGIDRLSIGIQTFDESTLKFYNRAHSAEESLLAIERAKSAGFQKLSIDLIYGFPAEDHSKWIADLDIALAQDPGHISSYCLTVEPKTALGSWEKKGTFRHASEEFAAEQFSILMDRMAAVGYIQYEISNFGKTGNFAVHNTNYWKSVPYLGVGPSAHSFDGNHRGFNLANNALYTKSMESGQTAYQTEPLEIIDIANEYILTSLRTIWGLDTERVSEIASIDIFSKHQKLLAKLEQERLIWIGGSVIYLTTKGKFIADSIAASLFV